MRTIYGEVLGGFNGKVKQAIQSKITPHKEVIKKIQER
jgi:hypothetical protein